ncbi:MAG: hypothetical protein RI955_819 [Bacteroidota bacterium]|jgi:hypothetical protein
MRFNKYHIAIVGIMIAAIIFRLFNSNFQWLANFSPIAAMALFGSANFKNKSLGFIVPFCIMIVSDCFLGFHSTMIFTYGSFALICLLGGSFLRNGFSFYKIIGASIVSSIIFFIVTNFGVWVMQNMYTKDLNGLVTCYVSAIPFLRNTMVGDLFFSAVFFSAFEYIKQTNWLVKAKV